MVGAEENVLSTTERTERGESSDYRKRNETIDEEREREFIKLLVWSLVVDETGGVDAVSMCFFLFTLASVVVTPNHTVKWVHLAQ